MVWGNDMRVPGKTEAPSAAVIMNLKTRQPHPASQVQTECTGHRFSRSRFCQEGTVKGGRGQRELCISWQDDKEEPQNLSG